MQGKYGKHNPRELKKCAERKVKYRRVDAIMEGYVCWPLPYASCSLESV